MPNYSGNTAAERRELCGLDNPVIAKAMPGTPKSTTIRNGAGMFAIDYLPGDDFASDLQHLSRDIAERAAELLGMDEGRRPEVLVSNEVRDANEDAARAAEHEPPVAHCVLLYDGFSAADGVDVDVPTAMRQAVADAMSIIYKDPVAAGLECSDRTYYALETQYANAARNYRPDNGVRYNKGPSVIPLRVPAGGPAVLDESLASAEPSADMQAGMEM